MSHIDKVIISSDSELTRKYGAAGKSLIDAAISRLIAADAARGLDTQYIAVDGSGVAALRGTPFSSTPADPDYKDAVDAIYNAHTPDYIAILGAPDVLPHQSLQNPLYAPNKDPDPLIPSDLPYACAAPYSDDAADFFAPDRVVSRLPDVPGASNPAYLVAVIDNAVSAVNAVPRPRAAYLAFLGISTAVWTKSTDASLASAFGNANGMQLSPAADPAWLPAQWAAPSHFINCHGAKVDFKFYGSDGSTRQYPAHEANLVAANAQRGTIVAAECCYGAELYDPTPYGIHQGIANTYLERGAFGYFGSTNIAYGNLDTTGYADLICTKFFQQVLAGSSLGAATLAARKEFVQQHSLLDPLALKTLAQFLLLGDPSIHAVQSGPAAPVIAMGVAAAALAPASPSELRAQRRQRAREDARALESTTIVSKGMGSDASADIIQKYPDLVKGGRTSVRTFTARPRRGAGIESQFPASADSTVFHVALTAHESLADEAAEDTPAGITRTMIEIVTEANGSTKRVTAYAR